METLLVMLIVAGCTAYAAWTLMPRAWQRAIAQRLGWRIAAAKGCGGGCDGCGDTPAGGPKPITLHRRPRG